MRVPRILQGRLTTSDMSHAPTISCQGSAFAGVLPPGQRLLLHHEIGIDVPLGPRRTLLAEPQLNPTNVHARRQTRRIVVE